MRTLELALSLLAVLSAQDDGFGTVLGLTTHEFDPATGAQPALTPWVGKLNQQALSGACPRYGEVLAIVNDVTKSVRASGNYRDATDFGNRVHIGVARRVNSQEDPDFKAEILLDPMEGKANPYKPGNVRLDLLENVRATQTVCVYDHKTGIAEISMARAMQLAANATRNYPYLKRIIIIQVKPQT
ncbi:hypothetical protein [Methylobacterium sp. GC_Met_2]|uniref:hypothetical protein n=1 Tax=Methylobacterium sp. GC_Met_2 TaxID=2937376 RepID=UPI00226B1A40|nr:hypothetical protein [Methylobacterium sp. GC_Met_2]